MFINGNSIIINGKSMGEYLLEAQFQYAKLWGEDTGRSLSGDFSGTLLGIYPKLILHFRRLNQEELEDIAEILDSATQTVSYYDPYLKSLNTMTTYTGDWTLVNRGIAQNQDFSISFISISKRSNS